MSGFLFEHIIFGPVKSRRLGISLGVNLLPISLKACTFDCLYCECGWTLKEEKPAASFPSRELVRLELEKKLLAMKEKNAMLDNITFAGNGEPTLHPDFAAIIDDTIELRNKIFPYAHISVLSNASRADRDEIAQALLKVDQNILKLDAGTEETYNVLNSPKSNISLKQIVANLSRFRGQMVIQSLFIKGKHKDRYIDNTTDHEIQEWLELIKKLQPRLVMIYPIARATPAEGLEKIGQEKLMEIARKVEALGIQTEVY